MVHWWAHPLEQWVRDDVLHGVMCHGGCASRSKEIAYGHTFWSLAFRICLVGCIFGTDESTDNSPCARVGIAMVEYSCVDYYDVLRIVCLHPNEWNMGTLCTS